jgi:thymidylate synthase (FAD)
MTQHIVSWHCKICGNFSSDFEEQEHSWEDHLKHHEISEEQYRRFTEDNSGGVSKIKVTLLSWTNNAELAILSFMNQAWGPTSTLENYADNEISQMVQMAIEGQTLPTALETINFTFQIEGISRACSHQLVRVRIGSGFSQKGMRDVYYGDIDYVIPATVEAVGKTEEYLNLMKKCSDFYQELFEAGVPYQDARFVIPHAATTTVVWTVNFLALKNFCANRLQNFMQWEINALARSLREEVRNVYPALADVLKPRCELTKSCQSFGNLFGGCGKFPLNAKHNRYVFLPEQATKNLRFDKDSVLKMAKHNETVRRTNNHWRMRVKELEQEK